MRVGRYFLIHLNKEYVRAGELEIEKMFLVDDMTEKITARLPQLEEQMGAAREILTNDREPMAGCDCVYAGRSAHCSTFKYSNPDVPDYSVHDLARIGTSKKKLVALVERRVYSLDDIPADIELSEIQTNQIRVHRTRRPIIDLEKIQEELGALVFPLYFLDYETFAPAIPMFSGYSPYSRIAFQFSLHILRSRSAEPEHVEYLHEERSDPSEAIAGVLVQHIDAKGTIISWNKSFEQGVNNELASRVSEHRAALERMNAHMYDLKDIFHKQYYVHHEFRGKTSIKKVLPALVTGVRHADLNIKEGGQASDAWWQMILRRRPRRSEKSRRTCERTASSTRMRIRRDEIFFSERRFLSQAVEVTLRAVTLDRPRRARMARVLVADGCVLDGEGVLVGAGRGLSRLVVGHCSNDTPSRRTSRRLSPYGTEQPELVNGSKRVRAV